MRLVVAGDLRLRRGDALQAIDQDVAVDDGLYSSHSQRGDATICRLPPSAERLRPRHGWSPTHPGDVVKDHHPQATVPAWALMRWSVKPIAIDFAPLLN